MFEQGLLWVIDQAVARGEVKRREIKRSQLLVPVLVGSVIAPEVRTKTPIDDKLVDGLTDFLLAGMGCSTKARR